MPKGWELSALQGDGENILLRIFNASGDASEGKLLIDDQVSKADLIELNGEVKQQTPVVQKDGKSMIILSMPRFGIRTLRLKIE